MMYQKSTSLCSSSLSRGGALCSHGHCARRHLCMRSCTAVPCYSTHSGEQQYSIVLHAHLVGMIVGQTAGVDSFLVCFSVCRPVQTVNT